MTSLLLILSFLLHAILLIAIYQLYQQLQQIKQTKENESHHVVQQFIAEIKEENKRLQDKLAGQPTSPYVREYHEITDEPNYTATLGTQQTVPTSTGKSMSRVDSITELTDEKREQMDVSFEGHVLQLYQQGFNTDQIAKQLGSGRTEVDLIIKFQSSFKT